MAEAIVKQADENLYQQPNMNRLARVSGSIFGGLDGPLVIARPGRDGVPMVGL